MRQAIKKVVACFTAVSAGVGFGVTLGCLTTRPRLNHCSYQEGDATCEMRYPDERPFCNWGGEGCGYSPAADGCVATRPSDECYSPCGGDAVFEESSSCFGAASSSSDDGGGSTMDTDGSATATETMDASESSTTGPMPCAVDDECTDSVAPFCDPVSGQCVPCAAMDDPDAACAGLDPGAPLCVGGSCVQCTAEDPVVCDEQLLLCDGASNACVPCGEHAECGSGACELGVGTCFPPGEVVHVDGDGGQDFTTVAAAVASVGSGLHGVIVVHEQDSGLGYPSATVDQGKTIALLAAAGEAPSVQGTGANPGLRIVGARTAAYVDGLEVSNAAVAGVVVDGAFAWVDRSSIVGNDGGGILAQNSAELTLRNCFAGGDVSDRTAVSIDGSVALLLYSTLGAGFGDAASLSCNGTSTVEVRNSLFIARADADEIQCGSATIEHSAAEMDLGGTNTALGAMATTWFMGYGSGDFHLVASAPITIATTAQWETDDPSVDIDGDSRPAVDGVPDVAGADVP
jgi:hypothetical protein